MKHVLMLSAHRRQIDRRILSEARTLVDAGRKVTLVTLPVVTESALVRDIEIVMPAAWAPSAGPDARGVWPAAKRIARRCLPSPVYNLLRLPRAAAGQAADTDCLVRLTPPAAYDAIHCHDLNTLVAAVRIRDRLPAARLIYDSHELYPFQEKGRLTRRFWSRMESRHIHRADRVIAVNESIADKLAELYGIARPEVIYNSYGIRTDDSGIDLGQFLNHFSAPRGRFKVLFQGSLSKERNIDSLIGAFGQLPSADLFLLGAGLDEERFRKTAAARGLTNVHFGRSVPQEKLLAYTRLADLGVIPYVDDGVLNNRLCTPNKLFEFIEAGVPICASDLPELRKIVRGGGIGEVYPMRNPAEIAQAVSDCRARCLAGQFTPAARQLAREKYSWARQARALLEIYERLGV